MTEELIEYAKHEFSLSKPTKNGKTLREHLQEVERQTGQKVDDLEGPKFPRSMAHVWSAFVSLSAGRSAGEPISYQEIQAWRELTQIPLEPWAVEVIKRLDNAYMRALNVG